MILAGGEFKNVNTENSKLVVDQLVERYWWLCPMRVPIMDHGSEFGAHRVHEDGRWDSDFKQHLERYGIKPILARLKHLQTNGKLERWFGEYKRHRLAFSSFEEFRDWYNKRPNGSLEMYFANSHEMKSGQVRNTFGTTHPLVNTRKGRLLKIGFRRGGKHFI